MYNIQTRRQETSHAAAAAAAVAPAAAAATAATAATADGAAIATATATGDNGRITAAGEKQGLSAPLRTNTPTAGRKTSLMLVRKRLVILCNINICRSETSHAAAAATTATAYELLRANVSVA